MKSNYEKLIELKNSNPELVFNNDGYEYLSKDVKASHKSQIEEIEAILKKTVEGFVRFDNFKPRDNDTFAVRMQTRWSDRFTGVEYINIEKFKN
jgi:hypothetical protein